MASPTLEAQNRWQFRIRVRVAGVHRSHIIVALALGLLCVSCRGPRRNAEQLVFAVRALREAPNAQKPPHLETLKSRSCDTESLCDYKARCVKAYALHLSAVQEVDRLNQVATASERAGDSAAVPSREEQAQYLAKLRKATDDLESAHHQAQDCLLQEASVVTDFRL